MYAKVHLDLWGEIKKVKAQIRKLHDAVNPGENLATQPHMYRLRSKEQMQMALKFTWDTWNKTFGAIDLIRSAL
ncbi:hypothetical protein N7508_001331 [Penicillium antarcticum]|uniref:uncharacterized protein n=1 Tax=Penicillium antarcticum TaxID=416450 RepID=UPI00239790DA|nr:uncharacterized protein N7508_001331 [Penicillium antarcticum]KAJ5316823.1 hypothetical protein N7508_001331 [Penicillium antarcticum]